MTKKDKKTGVSHLDHADKTILIELLFEKINLLEENNKKLSEKLKLLESRLMKNSSNSSKPPSSDHTGSGKKQKKTTSSRKKSTKKPGGQPGHPGTNLKMSSNPDEVVELSVTQCECCQSSLSKVSGEIDRRQEFDIPQPKMWVIEYQAEHKSCPHCRHVTTAEFPEHITHKTQYGSRAKSLMVYLNQYQLLPYLRAREFFHTVYNHKISIGTLVNAVNALGKRYTTVEQQIKKMLSDATVGHTDETSININSNKQWLHTVGTEKLTHYATHEKRGSKASMDIGILPKFKGTLVHDHWKSYYKYDDCDHGLCHAHHIREFRFLYEQHNMKWAMKMSALLTSINHKKMQWLKEDKTYFSSYLLKKYNDSYDDILKKARREQARRGTRDSANMLKRLNNFKADVLRFMTDFNVPFTNNLSERDLRMMKVKQKISGCFRNANGAEHFCKIRSIISTAIKNNRNIFDVLQLSFQKIISTDDLLAIDS